MANLVVKTQGDLMAVEFLPSQTLAAGGTATSVFQNIPRRFVFESFAVQSGGTGEPSVHWDSSLDIIDGDDTAVAELQSSSANELGVAALVAANARFPLMADNAAAGAAMLGPLRIERLRCRAIETGGAATVTGLRVVGYFRRVGQ